MYLQERKESRNLDNAKGMKLSYTEFAMAEYLCPSEENFTINEQKWLFQCRVEDIDIKGNHKWKHNNIFCSSCKKGIIENQSHILFCEYLLGKKRKSFLYSRLQRSLQRGSKGADIHIKIIERKPY